MWIALAAVALIAVAVAIVVLFRRPSGDDLNSVRSYHSALGTLEHLADRSGTPTVTVVGADDDPTGTAPEGRVPRTYQRSGGVSAGPAVGIGSGRSVPPVPVRGNDEFPDPEIPLIFDDSRPRDRYQRELSSEGIPLARTDRAQRHALDSMNHRPRRVTTVMIVLAAVVLFGVLAYVGSKRSPSHTHAASATSTTRVASHSTASTSAVRAATPPTTRPRTKPTPTTQPTQVVALTSTSTSATYPVVNSNYSVTVTGTGTCWVAVTGSSGSTLWAGEVQAGTVQVVPASGTVTVQLGTPSVTLAIDRVPVVLPTPTRAPFVATFQPTAAALAASPPTTATTSTTTASGSSAAGSTSSGSTATGATTPP
jgi:RodZ C-terminal domain